MLNAECSVNDCHRNVIARTWCILHYNRWRRNGDPELARNRWGQDRDSTEKQCSACERVLPVSDFYKRPETGRPVSRCKQCYGEAAKRRHQGLSKYGLTPSDYQHLYQQQAGLCAICKVAESSNETSPRLSVDHDHQTGAVRGLLCSACNAGLGMFKDDPGRLQAAISYLAR